MISRRTRPRRAHISRAGSYDSVASALNLPDVSDVEKQTKRVGRRILGLTPETVYVGLRLVTTENMLSTDVARGTVTNYDERFCDVDWDGGGWTRFEWAKPGLDALTVID